MSKMLDGNSAALSIYEAEQDARQRAFDSHEKEAEANVRERLADEGLEPWEIDCYLLSPDGADAVEVEVGRLEQADADAHIDAQIDQRREER